MKLSIPSFEDFELNSIFLLVLKIFMKNSPAYSSKSFGLVKENVIFFFTAFGHKYWLYYPAIKKLTKAGYYVIVYDINPNIVFNGNIPELLTHVDILINDIKKQVESLKKQRAKTFISFGNSAGTILAMRAAIEIADIQKVIINLTYGSLTDNIWSWRMLQGVKKSFENAGLSKSEVEKLLEPISPLSMAPKLKNKKLLLYLAKRDKIILFEQSQQFKEALDEEKIGYIYHQNNVFGHILSGAINLTRSKIYLDFLAS